MIEKENAVKEIKRFFEKYSVAPDAINGYLESIGSSPLKQQVKLDGVLIRPALKMSDLAEVLPDVKAFFANYDSEFIEQVQIPFRDNLSFPATRNREKLIVKKRNLRHRKKKEKKNMKI